MVSAAPAADATGTSAGTGTAAAVRPPMTMKLCINTKANRVLLAEASKETVDFLFSILATPVGTFAGLLGEGKEKAPGVSNLYNSVKTMNPTYMMSRDVQEALLHSQKYSLLQRVRRSPATMVPVPSTSVHGSTQPFAPSMPLRSAHRTNYAAPTRVRGVFHSPTTTVPVPSTVVQGLTPAFMHYPTPPTMPLPSAHLTNYAAPTSLTAAHSCTSCGAGGGLNTLGFVQDSVTYTVMDDLTITPKSSVSIMVLLNTLMREDKELVLEEKTVQIGYPEKKLIVMASLKSSTVLSDVFLSKESTEDSTSKKRRACDDKKIPDYYV